MNLSESKTSVLINKKPLKKAEQLHHQDLFTIIDRSFRLEFPESELKSPAKSPAKTNMSPRKSLSPKKAAPKILTPKVCIPSSWMKVFRILS